MDNIQTEVKYETYLWPVTFEKIVIDEFNQSNDMAGKPARSAS